jgi:hypothetical protein
MPKDGLISSGGTRQKNLLRNIQGWLMSRLIPMKVNQSWKWGQIAALMISPWATHDPQRQHPRARTNGSADRLGSSKVIVPK